MNEVYKLHSQLIKSGLHHDPLSLRRLLFVACSASASASYASSLLFSSQSPDTVSWNTIIRFLSHSAPSHSLSLFSHMRSNSISVDHFTFPFVLKSCSHLHLDRRDLHSLILKLGFDSDIYVQNSLISFYGSCGFVAFALKMFEEMPQRDLVSWSSMISCLVNNGLAFLALNTFRQMQVDGNVKPDEVTVVKVISAVSSLGALELGRWVHTFVRRNGLRITVKLGTSLIDMYSRCGSVEESMRVFDGMQEKNVLTWTVLINGLAVHGHGRLALSVYNEMKTSGLKPDYVTFTAVLVACSHGGLVEDGWQIFKSIKNDYNLEPLLEHYGCMVDVLGRAGFLCEAYKFVKGMPIRPNSIIWRTLLGACVSHHNLDLAEEVNCRIRELDPYHDGDYVLLSNAYGGAGRWVERAGLRTSMTEKRISKKPGYSLINMDQEVHEFVAGDSSHPQAKEIKDFLASIIDGLRSSGYTPQTSAVLYDIEDEEKEHNIGYHGEKLAVAFALLNFGHRKRIRVMKNLRICNDCHCFMKHVSIMFDIEVIVRDRNRFHRFVNGSCSCSDYW